MTTTAHLRFTIEVDVPEAEASNTIAMMTTFLGYMAEAVEGKNKGTLEDAYWEKIDRSGVLYPL